MQHRILAPREGGRGRKPNSSARSINPTALTEYYTQLQQSYQSQLGAMSGKAMALNSLQALNPMYAAQLAQFGMLPSGSTTTEEDREEGEITSRDKEKLGAAQAAAYNQMYSQLMMSQLYAQSLANASANSQYAALAAQIQAQQAAMVNGTNLDSEEEVKTGDKQAKLATKVPKIPSVATATSAEASSGRRKKGTPSRHSEKVKSKLPALANIPAKPVLQKTAEPSGSQDCPQDLSLKPSGVEQGSPNRKLLKTESPQEGLVQDLSRKSDRTDDELSNDSEPS